MSSRFRQLILCLSLLPLAACGTTHSTAQLSERPHEQAVVDPDDSVFRTAVQQYLAVNKAAASSQYEYTREDLDGDGRRDAIVMFEAPFYSWCSVDGCKMAIFKAANDHFSLLSEIAPVRGPLLLSNTKTNGLRDLVIRVSGRSGWKAKDVALKFDGSTYPNQPALAPALPEQIALADIHGTEIFP